jgi:uncharacterized protein (TIGR02145 family)
MKHFLLLLSFSLSLLTFAQTPKTISYQGVARNATGQPIPNQSIKIKLSLLETATSSNSLYTETHTPTTSGQGLFALQIGAGTVLSGTYANLDWSNGPKFVKTEIDPTGGDNFTLSSTNPLNAVPFALFAASGTPGPRGLKGDTGARGPQGSIGLTGPQGIKGDTGVRGPIGPQGIAGTNGKTILNGNAKPATSLGTLGDFYINTATDTLYGPKTVGGWGTGISLVGPKGSFPNGTNVGDMQYWNGSVWVMIQIGQKNQVLTIQNGTPEWKDNSGAKDYISDLEGNKYEIVTIGTQTWMAEDLQVTKFNNGDAIAEVFNSWLNLNSPCYLGSGATIFYNGFVVTDSRNVCPAGWHIPSSNEVTTLVNYLGGNSLAGKKLKSKGNLNWLELEGGGFNNPITVIPNTGDNQSRFSANGNGTRENISISGVGKSGYIGINTISSLGFKVLNMVNSNNGAYISDISKNTGVNIRCLKD